MKPEYNKVHVKMGKMSKAVPASKLEVDGMTLGELKETVNDLAKLVGEYQKTLEDHLIIPENHQVIMELDGKLKRGKISHVFKDNGENLTTRKVVDGELKKDMKVGIL